MIIKQLIDHYEIAIIKYKLTHDYETITEHHVQNGVCHCSKVVFDTSIYNDKWIETDGYWYDCPSMLLPYHFDSILQTLEFRLNKLKQIYEKATTPFILFDTTNIADE